MSVTYADDHVEADNTPYVPAYARGRAKSRKKVKTWMILAPIGAAILVGGGALMVMGGGEESMPLAESEIAAPVLPAAGLTPAPATPDLAASTAMTPAPVVNVPQPAVEPAAPVVQRRAAPERAAPVAAPVVEAPVEPTGPRPFVSEASPATSAATPPAPTITVQPLG